MNTQEALLNFCLRLADNNMIAAQRLAEWCSRGPILEEDLALTNISLDLFGQAENFYEYAATLQNNGKTADDLAFLRSEREYFNNLLVEQPNGDFAFSTMKQFLYAAFAKPLYEALQASKDETLKGITSKAVKEIKYHLRHSSEWLVRFGNGTEESLKRSQTALNELWRYTDDMFLMNDNDKALIEAGISIDLNTVKASFMATVNEIFKAAHLSIPETNNIITGGCNAIHSEHLGVMLCEMQYLQRAHPGAQW